MRYRRTAWWLLIGGALLPWFIASPRVMWQGWLSVLKPFPTCYTELVVLSGAMRLASGEPIFTKLQELPFVVHTYNFANYIPAGLIGRVERLAPEQLLVVSRVLPYLCTLGIFATVFIYLRRATTRVWPGLVAIAGLLYFHSAALTDFFRNRPETPALLCSLIGFAIAEHGRGRNRELLAGVAFAAAVAFKQTFCVAPIVVCAQLALRRDGPGLLRVVAGFAVPTLVGTACSYYFLGRGYFTHVYFAMADHPWQPGRGVQVFLPALSLYHWGSLLPGSLIAAFHLIRTRPASRPLLSYLGLSLAVSFVFASKLGSDINYFCELSTLMVITLAWGLCALFEDGRVLAYGVVALLGVGGWGQVVGHGFAWNEVCESRFAPSPHCFAPTAANELKPYTDRYRSAPAGDTLILNFEIGVRSGMPTVSDWFTVGQAFNSGLLDFTVLERAVLGFTHRRLVFGIQDLAADPWTARLFRTALAAGYRVSWRTPLVVELTLAPTPSQA